MNATGLFNSLNEISTTDSLGSEAAEAPRPFNVESLRWALVYQILSVANVLLSDPKSNPSNQARPKPVHPNQVLVSQKHSMPAKSRMLLTTTASGRSLYRRRMTNCLCSFQTEAISSGWPCYRAAIGYNRVFDQIPLHQRRNSGSSTYKQDCIQPPLTSPRSWPSPDRCFLRGSPRHNTAL